MTSENGKRLPANFEELAAEMESWREEAERVLDEVAQFVEIGLEQWLKGRVARGGMVDLPEGYAPGEEARAEDLELIASALDWMGVGAGIVLTASKDFENLCKPFRAQREIPPPPFLDALAGMRRAVAEYAKRLRADAEINRDLERSGEE